MNITKTAIEWNRVTFVMLLMVILGGLITKAKLPQAEDPGFIIRTAMVKTIFPGASPTRVEQLVTDKLEKVIQEIPELDYVKSESRTGISIIYVNIDEKYKKMRPIWDDLRRKVKNAERELPKQIIGPFVNDDFGDVYGEIMTITGDGFNYAELKSIADEVRDEILRIEDVAKVEIYGDQEERIFIEFNSAKLAELGIPPVYLKKILDERNIITPGGNIDSGNENISLETTGNFETVDDILKTVVTLPGRKELVSLEDLVKIKRGYIDPPSTIMHYNGTPCLGLAISMRDGGNIIKLGKALKTLHRKIQSIYPLGVDFNFVAFQPDRVNKSVKNFESNLIQSILIVVAVMLVSLGIRTGLLVASLIPVTILMAFILMGVFDIGIDTISLAALLIALGILVDNAIVMSESIMTQSNEGKTIKQAAIDSAKELSRPLLTASLTTSLAFLPIFLAKSSVGEYTSSLFKVVTITLLSSWVLALTMIPLLCVIFLKTDKNKEESYNSKFYKKYRKSILSMLKHRTVTIFVVIMFFALAMYSFRFVPKRFMPDSDRKIITAILETPPGSSIQYTEKKVKEFEGFLKTLQVKGKRKEGIVNWGSFIGEGAPRYILSYSPDPPQSSFSYTIINTSSFEVVANTVKAIESFCNENLPDVKAQIALLSVGPPVKHPIAVRITGKNTDKLFKIVDQIKNKLDKTEGIKYSTDNWGRKTKKILVKVNQDRARRAGITSQDIAVSLQSTLSGITIGQYRENDDLIPISLRSVAADRNDISKLESHNVYQLSSGRAVPLKQVADVSVVFEYSKILRRDRFRSVEVQADINQGYNALEINASLIKWLETQKKNWPLGYNYEIAGEAEKSASSNKSISEQLPLAGMLIMILLISQFNSIRRTAILLCIVPLGMIGVTAGLLIADSYFGFMTLLGVVALSGIVINNANVLLDRIRIEIDENRLSPQKAVIEASQRRLRPILLTTLTTAGGLIPLWIGGGPLFKPMAVSIIFGLIFATIITLGVVPVLYSLFLRVNYKNFSLSD